MSKNSSIQWTGNTWPIVTGCEFESEGCANCYALKDSWRLSHNPNPKVSDPYKGTVIKAANGKLQWSKLIKCHPDRLNWVLQWKKPSLIFVCNMSDLFHESVPDEFIYQAFAYMAITPHHTYQVLTKRPKRMMELLQSGKQTIRRNVVDLGRNLNLPYKVYEPYETCCFDWPLQNVWLGVSAENQKAANERIVYLRHTPARIRFLSCEPLLEHIELFDVDGEVAISMSAFYHREMLYPGEVIDWVILGGESGANARPCRLEWIRHIAKQCEEIGIPVFIKQLGRLCLQDDGQHLFACSHPKGGDVNEFPPDLQIRQFPNPDA